MKCSSYNSQQFLATAIHCIQLQQSNALATIIKCSSYSNQLSLAIAINCLYLQQSSAIAISINFLQQQQSNVLATAIKCSSYSNQLSLDTAINCLQLQQPRALAATIRCTSYCNQVLQLQQSIVSSDSNQDESSALATAIKFLDTTIKFFTYSNKLSLVTAVNCFQLQQSIVTSYSNLLSLATGIKCSS